MCFHYCGPKSKESHPSHFTLVLTMPWQYNLRDVFLSHLKANDCRTKCYEIIFSMYYPFLTVTLFHRWPINYNILLSKNNKLGIWDSSKFSINNTHVISWWSLLVGKLGYNYELFGDWKDMQHLWLLYNHKWTTKNVDSICATIFSLMSDHA